MNFQEVKSYILKAKRQWKRKNFRDPYVIYLTERDFSTLKTAYSYTIEGLKTPNYMPDIHGIKIEKLTHGNPRLSGQQKDSWGDMEIG